jgi:methylglutaconyl-CoA hydratase
LARRDPALIAGRKFARLAHDRRAIQRLNVLPIPTVALVQGASFGGGTGIISACDIVIAADNATFSIAEVRIGVAATIIIPQLNDAIGVRQVRRYALTGERFDVKEAYRIGLVHEIAPLKELRAAGGLIFALLAWFIVDYFDYFDSCLNHASCG